MSKKSKENKRLASLNTTQEDSSKKLKTTPIVEGNIHFRFDYFDSSHTFFDGSNADYNWIRSLIKRLKELQNITVDIFKTNMGFRQSQYVHPINWNNAKLNSFGLQNVSQDLDEDAWQFGISKANGRVHGFFIGDFFYIVWIDPDHRLFNYRKPN